ncbi:MAG: SDR family NAD(P)-dependent oxidoreductase [Ilumatobacteraceae bacterium]
MELSGRVAVVTGAGSGIGLSMARRFATENMSVVLADVDGASLTAAAADLRGRGAHVHAVRTDVADEAQLNALASEAVEVFGAVHLLANNAGIASPKADVQSFPQSTWERLVDVNLWGTLRGIRAFLPLLEAQGEGHIINTASTAGLQASPGIAPYNVTKAAIIALSETLAAELRAKTSPIGVSVLCPGPVRTNILRADADPEAQQVLNEHGMDPDRVAGLVAEAVSEGHFWILTHPEWEDTLRQRLQAQIAGLLRP